MFSQRSWTTVSLLFFSPPFILTRIIGRITKYTTFPEGRLGLTNWKRNCLPTGTHPSPRSVSVWRLEISSTLSWLTRRLTLCIHWLLMGNTAQPHWVVTHGKSWLVHRPLCSFIATGKVLMLFVTATNIQKLELVLLATSSTEPAVAYFAHHGLDLVQAVYLITTVRVVTKHGSNQIMKRNV